MRSEHGLGRDGWRVAVGIAFVLRALLVPRPRLLTDRAVSAAPALEAR